MCSIWTAEGFVFVHCCTEVLEKLVSHMRHKPLHAHAVGYLTLFPPWSSAQGLAVKLAALTGSHQRRSPQCLVQAVKTRHKAACRCCRCLRCSFSSKCCSSSSQKWHHLSEAVIMWHLTLCLLLNTAVWHLFTHLFRHFRAVFSVWVFLSDWTLAEDGFHSSENMAPHLELLGKRIPFLTLLKKKRKTANLPQGIMSSSQGHR